MIFLDKKTRVDNNEICVHFFIFYRWVELLLSNSNLIDYIYAILREKRVSLNDPIILTFIELYFPKVRRHITHLHRCNCIHVAHVSVYNSFYLFLILMSSQFSNLKCKFDFHSRFRCYISIG